MNQADVSVGIPAMVNCLILVPFSVFFHYAYDVGPYMIDLKSVPEHGDPAHYLHYQGGVLGIRAFLAMLNPGEILGAIGFMFTMRSQRRRGLRRDNNNHHHRAANGATGGGRGYDTVTSTDGRDAGVAHEMSRRDQRRVDKHGPGDRSRRYDHQRGQDAPYGWTTTQNGGHGNGQYQQEYR